MVAPPTRATVIGIVADDVESRRGSRSPAARGIVNPYWCGQHDRRAVALRSRGTVHRGLRDVVITGNTASNRRRALRTPTAPMARASPSAGDPGAGGDRREHRDVQRGAGDVPRGLRPARPWRTVLDRAATRRSMVAGCYIEGGDLVRGRSDPGDATTRLWARTKDVPTRRRVLHDRGDVVPRQCGRREQRVATSLRRWPGMALSGCDQLTVEPWLVLEQRSPRCRWRDRLGRTAPAIVAGGHPGPSNSSEYGAGPCTCRG